MDARERTRQALEKTAQLTGFYIHLAAYLAVIFLLFVINFVFDDAWWVQWVAAGWGIGIAAHAFAVFWEGSFGMSDWQRRRTRKEPGR